MDKLDPTTTTLAIDRLLEVTEEPRHRQILENYRRHALLEVSGRWREILEPEMTVEHPVYRINGGGRSMVIDGREQLAEFYGGMTEVGASVMILEDERLAVADWGFGSESIFNHYAPGAFLIASGEEVDDPGATYLLRHRLAMIWHYDERARLIGEHVYEDGAYRELTKLAPEDVVTPEEAREALAPLIRPLPSLLDATGSPA
jgi:hypothetical protein